MDYTLTFSGQDLTAESGSYQSLDTARDAAFDLSLETGEEIAILQSWGAFSEIVESVKA